MGDGIVREKSTVSDTAYLYGCEVDDLPVSREDRLAMHEAQLENHSDAQKKPKEEAKPKAVKPPKPRQTEEEKRAYRREWARKFREKNPGAAYKY